MKDLGLKYWGSLLTKIPDHIAKQMTRSHIRVYELLYELTRRHGAMRPSGAKYTTPSLMYIANKCFIRIETASRAIQDLHRWGLIIRIHRRQEEGRWKTNLYKLGLMTLQLSGHLTSWIHSKLNHLTRASKIGNLKKSISTSLRRITVNNKSPDNYNYQETLKRLKEKALKAGRWETTTT